jgi:PAS domain S-box-containing protein
LDLNKIKNLEAIINNLYEGAYIVDKSRKLIYWNKTAEDISGYKASEVNGSYCFDNILQHVDADGNSIKLRFDEYLLNEVNFGIVFLDIDLVT